ADVRDAEWSAGAVELACPAAVVLGADEVGQHVFPAPARAAGGLPSLVVLGLAANEDEPVDRTGAAEAPPARPVHAAVVHARIRLGAEAPVVVVVEHRLAVADRQVYPHRAIGGAGFQQ